MSLLHTYNKTQHETKLQYSEVPLIRPPLEPTKISNSQVVLKLDPLTSIANWGQKWVRVVLIVDWLNGLHIE